MASVWQQFAEETKSIDNLLIAEFDMQYNEIPGLEIEELPTLILFTNGDLNNEIRFKMNQFNLGSFRSFLKVKSPVF